MSAIRPLVAGNWKMNGLRASEHEIETLITGLDARPVHADVLICPPATLIAQFAGLAKGSRVEIGAQDCHDMAAGPHTGDISAEMLADAGATTVIVGHSERRQDHGETNELVKEKALAAHRAGLSAIVCVGETKAERDAGKTLEVVAAQLQGSLPDGPDSWASTVIAYEPIWAIGSGVAATLQQVGEVHAMIRAELQRMSSRYGEQMRILYGGSVKPENAAELLSIDNVDGALVGGASLSAGDLLEIASVYR